MNSSTEAPLLAPVQHPAEIPVKTNFRILAASSAVVLSGLTFFAVSQGLQVFVEWFHRLTPHAKLVVRTLCFASPAVLVPIGMALRRRRDAADAMAAEKSDELLCAPTRDADGRR